MKWTKELPAVSGWYWWRATPDHKPIVLSVNDWPGGGLALYYPRAAANLDGYTTPGQIGGEWEGPLKPPE
jgi:hypothetical protein